MNAKRITLTTSDEVASLRRKVLYGLAIDSNRPNTVYLCVHCATIIGFTDSSQMLDVRDVYCPECGTFNTLQAA